jgi:hypothetical protein
VALSFLFFFSLTYKFKVIGQQASYPFYIFGLVFGIFTLLYLLLKNYDSRTYFFKNIDTRFYFYPILTCLFIFIGSILYPEKLSHSFYSISVILLEYLILSLLILIYGWPNVMRLVFYGLMLLSLLNIFLLITIYIEPTFSLFIISPIESGYGDRVFGTLGDPSSLASLFSITLLMLILLRDHFAKIPIVIISISLLIGLFFTGSRNCFLALLVSLSLVAFMDKSLFKFLNVIFFISVIGYISCLIFGDFQDKFFSLFRVNDPNSFSRLDIWVSKIESFIHKDVFTIMLGTYFDDGNRNISGAYFNGFIKTIINLGVIFFITFMSFVVLIIYKASNLKDPLLKKICLAQITFWIIYTLFMDTIYSDFFQLSEFVLWFSASLILTSNPKLFRTKPGIYIG